MQHVRRQFPNQRAWSTAEDLLDGVTLTKDEQLTLSGWLDETARATLRNVTPDDFDLVYEYLRHAALRNAG